MFVFNPLTNDARVFREAGALARQGHTVDVIGWYRRGLDEVEARDGFTIHRVRAEPPHKRLARIAAEGYRRLGLHRGVNGMTERMARGEAQPVAAQSGWPGPQKRRSLLYRELMLRDWHRRALRLAKRLGPADVYHAHDLNTLPVAERAARWADARLIYDSHEIYLERWLVTPLERRIWRRIERRLIGRADEVITVCDPIADELGRRYGIEKPTVLLNCPDLAAAVPAGSSGRLDELAQLGGSDEPIVLYQGMIQPERGLEDLVEAAKSLDRGVVVMVGRGVWMSKLQEEIDSSGLSERVRMTGPVPPGELPSYTAGATIGVAPFDGKSLNSRWTSPNKLFEYLAAGLPVVATRLPVLESVVERYEVGLLCEPADPASLAAAINRLLADRELYERLRVNAIEASKVFNWDQESKKLLDVYGRLGGARS